MQRPVLPQKYKKAIAIVGLVAIVLVMTRRIDAIPDWVMWTGVGLAVLLDIYVLYWAMRQGCWAYTAVNIGSVLAIGICYYLLTTWSPETNPDTNPLVSDICLYSIIVLAATVMLFDIVAAYYMIRRKSYPTQYSGIRRLVWPVNIGLYVVISILCVLMVYA